MKPSESHGCATGECSHGHLHECVVVLALHADELFGVNDRPLDDSNVLIGRCEKREPLSLAEQRELWEWLEERDVTIGDQDEELQRLRAIVAPLLWCRDYLATCLRYGDLPPRIIDALDATREAAEAAKENP